MTTPAYIYHIDSNAHIPLRATCAVRKDRRAQLQHARQDGFLWGFGFGCVMGTITMALVCGWMLG